MKIIVLAGGTDQIDLITGLKKRGHEVILIDYLENPPAKEYADKHYQTSTLDTERVEKIMLVESADLICTACTDQALLTVAKVSERLGKSCYLPYQTALQVTNKEFMKKILASHHIPTSHFIIKSDANIESMEQFRFPLIVKPVDCNSSKGVKKVYDINDVPKYINNALQLSRTKKIVIEEYKDGEEISADFYIENGIPKFLLATKSLKIKNTDSFTILGSDYPAITHEQESAITAIASNIANAFHLLDTPLLIQLIINGQDINVIEFSARMGGGSKCKLIKTLTDVDMMSNYIDLILHVPPQIIPIRKESYCRMVYVYSHPGVFDHIEGMRELKQDSVIDDYFIYKSPKSIIEKAETSSDRVAGYIVTATDKETLEKKISLADQTIKVISDHDTDMMIHHLIKA